MAEGLSDSDHVYDPGSRDEAPPQAPAPAPVPADQQADEPPQPLRVAWVASASTLDDLCRTLKPLLVGLMDELVSVTLVSPSATDACQLPSPLVEVIRHRRGRWPWMRRRAVDRLAEHPSLRRAQVLHALDAESAGLADALGRRLSRHYVVSSYNCRDGRRLARLRARGAAFLAASKLVRDDLLKARAGPAERMAIVRPGVYSLRHATCFENPGCSVAIVASGRLDDEPAWSAVLKCFAELRARQYDCVFFIIGTGRAEKRLHARADKLGIRQSLTFVDYLPAEQLHEVFKAADLYVAPAPDDGVDLQALTAMAAGVPVLAARDGADDFLIDKQTAKLFARGSAEELTAGLASLIDDRAAARAMAESALEYIRRNHSPAEMVAQVAEIYRQAAQLPPRA